MRTAISKDGTSIAYDELEKDRHSFWLAARSTPARSARTDRWPRCWRSASRVINYDRRGKGESGDTPPWAVEREIEDLDALIESAGGSASVFGISSGAALALEAASRGLAIEKLALYEAPFIVDDSRPPLADDYLARLQGLVASDRPDDAIRLFMREGVGLPAVFVAHDAVHAGLVEAEGRGPHAPLRRRNRLRLPEG